jgi:rRNA maturation endonuclease Nob1
MYMPKKYNLNSKSDMNKFKRDLESAALNIAQEKAMDMAFDVICTNCKRKIRVKAGQSVCPVCGGEIIMNLNFK